MSICGHLMTVGNQAVGIMVKPARDMTVTERWWSILLRPERFSMKSRKIVTLASFLILAILVPVGVKSSSISDIKSEITRYAGVDFKTVALLLGLGILVSFVWGWLYAKVGNVDK